MIYILQQSKKTHKLKTYKFDVTNAKNFLYSLHNTRFYLSDYYVMGSDLKWEIEDILNYFTDIYLIKQEHDTFDRYYINPEIKKPDRVRDTKIRMSSIQKLKEQIIVEFPEYFVNYEFKLGLINIQLYSNAHNITFVLDENLMILESFISTDNEDSTPLSILDETKLRLNKLLTKKRYYYKNKG